MIDVVVVMGSVNDMGVMQKTLDVLKVFPVTYDCRVISAHRTPERLYDFSCSAHNHYKVIIAGAGGAAHLPGMIASMTILPVIGVPVSIEPFKGVDSLMSIVQMPKGVPVATVAVDGSVNAGLMAIRILAVANKLLVEALQEYRYNMSLTVPDRPS